MMESLSALAVVPKAKAIAARRLTKAEYAELMRKHSVLEIVAYLKDHPYFRHSLAGSTAPTFTANSWSRH